MLSVADQITAEVREELRKLMNPTKEDLVSASNGSPAEHSSPVALDKGRITIDHGSVSLGCHPETIQLFVDRMVAAHTERALNGAAYDVDTESCNARYDATTEFGKGCRFGLREAARMMRAAAAQCSVRPQDSIASK